MNSHLPNLKMKKTFTYTGKENMIFSVNGEDYNCISGKNYEIDSQDEHVKTLIGVGLLKEVLKPTPAPKPAPVKAPVVEPKEKESSTTL
jgi:hypothetical protein